MSKITAGQVEIVLDGETLTLLPTLEASLAISRRFDGLDPAVRKVLALDIDAVAFVVAAGAGIKGSEAKALPNKVWGHLSDVVGLLVDYLLILRNGGRPVDESKSEEDEGNAQG